MFKILKFNDIQNDKFAKCCGIVGYLFLDKNKYLNLSYVPSSFIRAMSSKCKVDILEYLIKENYIELKVEEDLEDVMLKSFRNVNKFSFKTTPNIYKILYKLRTLQFEYLNDDDIEKSIINNLHYLNNIKFNHYRYNYRNIKIDIDQPTFKVYLNQMYYNEKLANKISYTDYISSQWNVVQSWGNKDHKDYNIQNICVDDKFSGRHHNIFTYSDLDLVKHTSLKNPIEYGIYQSLPTILASHLLKNFKIKDIELCNYFSKKKQYLFKDEERNVYTYINSSLGFDMFNSSVFGYNYVEEFSKLFPNTNDLLYRIKSGELFKPFVSGISPKIFKNDFRLQTEDEHIFKRGQIYYKVISLVCQQLEVEIMRYLWNRLIKFKILFIPLHHSVIIAEEHIKPVKYITEYVWKRYIDRRIKLYYYERKF